MEGFEFLEVKDWNQLSGEQMMQVAAEGWDISWLHRHEDGRLHIMFQRERRG